MATAAKTYTHIGGRAYTGHYAVTADAYRTPGKIHALNSEGFRLFRAVCGETVHQDSDDHFFAHGNPIKSAPDANGTGITCTRCRRSLGITRWVVQARNAGERRWFVPRGEVEHEERGAAEAAMAIRQQRFPRTEYRVRKV